MQSPGFRFASDGPNSGEEFRQSVLAPALRSAIARGSQLEVELDGVSGYGSSFLEEAFGGLIRKRLFTREQLNRHLRIVARQPLFRPYQLLAGDFINRAKPEPETAAA
jgi:hypothetical protein